MKKIISVLLVVVVAAFIFAPAALANTSDLDKITAQVEALNAQIEQKVVKAQEQADKFINKGKEDKVDKVIEKLVNWVDKKAEKMIEKAAKYGIEVYCEYVTYDIGGVAVEIDPLIIGGY